MTPEKIIQNSIVKYLNEMEKKGAPILHERRKAGGFGYKKGIPDIYVVANGIHLEVEVKKPGGKLSVAQEKFRDICYKRSIQWIVVDNLDDFKEYLKKLVFFN